jgi:CarD family transcriptional regulator
VDFKIGERVVYPNHGIGIINKIEEKRINGMTSNFYCLKILSNDTTVLIPMENVGCVGLRKVIPRKHVKQLLERLEAGHVRTTANWKGRFKENSDKMRSGCIFEVADVLKSLFVISHTKSLSYREKRMLDKAKQLIISEIAEAKRTNPKKVEDVIEKALLASIRSKVDH